MTPDYWLALVILAKLSHKVLLEKLLELDNFTSEDLRKRMIAYEIARVNLKKVSDDQKLYPVKNIPYHHVEFAKKDIAAIYYFFGPT